jgi:hypothetical protein
MRLLGIGVITASIGLAGCETATTAGSPDTSTTTAQKGPPIARTYPASACMAPHPMSLLLPVSALPHMTVNPGAFADGGQVLDPFALAVPGTRRSPELASAAVVNEQMIDTQAPRSALQNASQFNVRHPTAITTFDEGITGFTSAVAERAFWALATPSGRPPWGTINGHGAPTHRVFAANSPLFRKPNTIVMTSLADSPTPTEIDVNVRSGATVVGLSFEGGVGLTVSEIAPIARRALQVISSACRNSDIMIGASRASITWMRSGRANVPDVVKMPIRTAMRTIRSWGLVPRRVATELCIGAVFPSAPRIGAVAQQRPAAFTFVEPGSTVTLFDPTRSNPRCV